VSRSWQSLLLSFAQESDEHAAEYERAKTGEVSTPVDFGSSPTPSSAPVVSVRMNRDGQVLESVGSAEDLAAASAYALHMAIYIGETLGLDAFKGAEFRAGDVRTLVVVEKNGDLSAFRSTVDANLADARTRAGL
jgi:hypothetical protein